MSRANKPTASRTFDDPDRTARARIRDAAIERFATDGVPATHLKDIAADAGVSTPLVIHHFGSKEGLRVACDEYVAAVIKAQKHKAMASGKSLDPFQALREAYEGTPVLRYLAKTIVDGSPHVDRLFDEMIEDSLNYMAEGVENGILKPTDHPREQAIVLFLWQMGSLALHEHAKRLLGIDLTSERVEDAFRWVQLNTEILAKGVINEDFYDTFMKSATHQSSEAEGTQTRTSP